jgi:hypothetical protein
VVQMPSGTVFGFAHPLVIAQTLRWRKQSPPQSLKEDAFSSGTSSSIQVWNEPAGDR